MPEIFSGPLIILILVHLPVGLMGDFSCFYCKTWDKKVSDCRKPVQQICQEQQKECFWAKSEISNTEVRACANDSLHQELLRDHGFSKCANKTTQVDLKTGDFCIFCAENLCNFSPLENATQIIQVEWQVIGYGVITWGYDDDGGFHATPLGLWTSFLVAFPLLFLR